MRLRTLQIKIIWRNGLWNRVLIILLLQLQFPESAKAVLFSVVVYKAPKISLASKAVGFTKFFARYCFVSAVCALKESAVCRWRNVDAARLYLLFHVVFFHAVICLFGVCCLFCRGTAFDQIYNTASKRDAQWKEVLEKLGPEPGAPEYDDSSN